MNAEQRAEALRLAEDYLTAVLCDPEGKCCIGGFPTDRRIVDDALGILRTLAAESNDDRTRSQKLTDAGFSRRPSLWAVEARQALELIAAPMRPDGTWNRDREACRQIAAEALGRHDEEKL